MRLEAKDKLTMFSGLVYIAEGYLPYLQLKKILKENQPLSLSIFHFMQGSFKILQCVELKLRWQFYVHGSTWPKIYFWLMLWIVFDISNTKSWIGFAQKQNWNIIEEILFEKSKKLQFLKLQICFLANPSQDMVFEVSKMIQQFDYR